jgi:hypothetical protein
MEEVFFAVRAAAVYAYNYLGYFRSSVGGFPVTL